MTRVTEKPNSSAPINKEVLYYYDHLNRLVKRTIDADGAGSGVATSQYWAYDDGINALVQYEGASASTLSHRYLWSTQVDEILSDEQVTSLSSGGNPFYAMSDHLGSVRDIADLNESTGVTAIANHRTFNAYGKLISESNSTIDLLFAFTGKQLDEATNLQHNLNRWYDSGLGQWLSEDPLGLKAGDSNFRRYVYNSVTLSTDSSGLEDSSSSRQQRYRIDQDQYVIMQKGIAGESASDVQQQSIAQLLQAGCIGLAYARLGASAAAYTWIERNQDPVNTVLQHETTLFHNSDSEKAFQAAMDYKNSQLLLRQGTYTILAFQEPGMIIENSDITAANSMITYEQITRDKAIAAERTFNFATYLPDTNQWEWMNHGIQLAGDHIHPPFIVDEAATRAQFESDAEYVLSPYLPSQYDPRVYIVHYRPTVVPNPAPLTPGGNAGNPQAPSQP